MRPLTIRWHVCCRGYWWQFGKWVAEPDRKAWATSHAYPKTKVGAFRIAGKCPPGAEVEVAFRCPKSTRRFPQGYERICRWVVAVRA